MPLSVFGQPNIALLEATAHKNKLFVSNSDVGTNYDLHYHRLNWTIDPAQYYIKGSVTSYFHYTQSDVTSIRFDMSDYLQVDSVWYGQSKQPYTLSDNILEIQLPSGFRQQYQADSVTVFYQGAPYQNGFGSFEQDYHNGTPIIWTLSEPYGARDWWPCKQNLSDKIDSIDVIVTSPPEYKAASNGVLFYSDTNPTRTISHWKHRHPIATYLIAIAVTNYAVYSDYASCSQTDEQIQILNYVYPENLNYTKQQTQKIVEIIELFNKLFIPYPFKDEKYGHAEFGWGGGMEHQTMSFMGGFSQFLMAHELAHQWFGNYITCRSWKDIWLNEGFAVYMEGLIVEHGLTDVSFRNWLRDEVATITSQAGGSVYVDDTTSVYRIFDGRLTYAKGGMVLHMLRRQIGDEAFFEAIRNYLLDEKIKNNYATTPQLIAHFEATAQKNLGYFFDDWIYGQGFPVYTVVWQHTGPDTVSINLHQTQSHASVDFFELKVPVQLIGSQSDTIIWLDNTENDQIFEIPLHFQAHSLVFNPNYDIVTRGSNVQEQVNDLNELTLTIRLLSQDGKYIVSTPNAVAYDKIAVYSLNGRLIKAIYPKQKTKAYELNLSDIPAGAYLVVFQKGNQNISRKLLKN